MVSAPSMCRDRWVSAMEPLRLSLSENEERQIVSGCFGVEGVLPLLTDLVSSTLLQIIVRGFQRETGYLANILQNDGFILDNLARLKGYSQYHVMIRSTQQGGRLLARRDAECAREVMERGVPILEYQCEGGMSNMAIPLYIKPTESAPEGTGIPIALLFAGQRVVRGRQFGKAEIARLAQTIGFTDVDELARAYRSLNVVSEQRHEECRERISIVASEITRLATREYHRLRRERGNAVYRNVATSIEAVFRRRVAGQQKGLDDSFLWQQIGKMLAEINAGFGMDVSCAFEEVPAATAKPGQRPRQYHLRSRAVHVRDPVHGKRQGEVTEFIGASPLIDDVTGSGSGRVAHVDVHLYADDPFLARVRPQFPHPLAEYDIYCAAPSRGLSLSGMLVMLRYRAHHTKEFHRLVDSGNEEILTLIVREIGTSIDVLTTIAQLETAQKEIQDKIRQLERLQANRQTLVTVIAHQIMAPIHTAELYIALLRKDVRKLDPEKVHQHLDIVSRQTAILEHRVRSFINYTKTFDSGIAKQLFGKSPWQRGSDKLSLLEIAQEVAGEIESFAEANEQKITVLRPKLPGREFPTIIGAYEEIKDVIINLLHNAIKYSGRKTTITVRFEIRRQEVCMTVESFGVPIADEDRERIFEFSYRTQEARALKTAGTGIGLSIARSIVENHGGVIRVKESTFWDRRDGQTLNRNVFEVRLPT
jgi:signal transduction histidine kinase/ligand-binding sensor protein